MPIQSPLWNDTATQLWILRGWYYLMISSFVRYQYIISMYISIAEVRIWIMTLSFSPALHSFPKSSFNRLRLAGVFCLVSMHAIENGAISSARKKSSVSLSTSANGWRPGMKRSPIDELKRQVQGGGGGFFSPSKCENTFFFFGCKVLVKCYKAMQRSINCKSDSSIFLVFYRHYDTSTLWAMLLLFNSSSFRRDALYTFTGAL